MYFWVFFTTFLPAMVLSMPTRYKISLCQSMIPETEFNSKPQTSTVPFQVMLDKETIHPGDKLTLVLTPIKKNNPLLWLILIYYLLNPIGPKFTIININFKITNI